MNLWGRILENLEQRLDKRSYDTWFRQTKFHSMKGDTLTVLVPNRFFRDWILEEFSSELTQAIEEVSDGKTGFPGASTLRMNFIAAGEIRPQAASSSMSLSERPANLNPRYTFDTFVVGNSNQFAHAAARRVAESPSTGYNPLFLYGGVGLGKTHLIHAIGHQILASGRKVKLTYISAERFMNELIRAIRTEKLMEFRALYRQSDVLLMDDIQFIQGKERTQEEFFHTFNELHESGRQIVLSSDRPPAEIMTIEERLKSRFEWGLRADIQPPELETKIAILEKKAEAEGIRLPHDVSLFIASGVQSNVRILEGSLIRLIALSSLTGRAITLDLAKESLTDLCVDHRPPTVREIIKRVADYYDMKPADIKTRSNKKCIAFPRQVAMWLAKRLTRSSYPDIGREFGGKHHTTVMHSVNKIETMRKSDPDFHRILDSLSESIQAT